MRLLLIAAGLMLALPAAAQQMYKSTLPDGRVVYGDKPAQGAVKVETITPDTANTGLSTAPSQRDTQQLRQLEQERVAREKRDERLRTAQQRHAAAEAARAAGVEPIEGERIGTAGGSSRLTEAYHARQRGLESAVENARREVEAARSAVR